MLGDCEVRSLTSANVAVSKPYWLMYFNFESESLKDLNRQFQLNDNILRHLVTHIDDRLIDHLVAVAKGEVAPVKHEIETSPSGQGF